MAIWQFYIDFFSAMMVTKKIGSIPDRLPAKYLTSSIKSNIDFDNYEDPTIEFWEGYHRKDLEELISELTYKLPEVEWLKNSKDVFSWGNPDTNDLTLSFAENDMVENFNCRIDLRDIDESFIVIMLELCKSKELLIADRKRNLKLPERIELAKLIANSNSANFVADPEKFIRDFDQGKLSP